MVEENETPAPTAEEIAAKEEAEKQDLLKQELEKRKSKYTEQEKAEYTLKSTAKRLKEMGKDPAIVLGIKGDETIEDDDVPDWYRAEKAREATKTALQMADDITNDTEKELVKHYLNNRIVPSGNPKQDFQDALKIVNSEKNAKIIEMAKGKPQAKRAITNGGEIPPGEEEPEFTPEEEKYRKSGPLHLTDKQILEARKKAQV